MLCLILGGRLIQTIDLYTVIYGTQHNIRYEFLCYEGLLLNCSIGLNHGYTYSNWYAVCVIY